jgi:hypothetical protein
MTIPDSKHNYFSIVSFLLFFILYCSIVYLVAIPPNALTSASQTFAQHVDSSRVFLARRGFMQVIPSHPRTAPSPMLTPRLHRPSKTWVLMLSLSPGRGSCSF